MFLFCYSVRATRYSTCSWWQPPSYISTASPRSPRTDSQTGTVRKNDIMPPILPPNLIGQIVHGNNLMIIKLNYKYYYHYYVDQNIY